MGYPVLDPLGGLVVSGMILKAGASIGYDAFKELVDEVTDPSFVGDVRQIVESRIGGSAAAGQPSEGKEEKLPVLEVESIRAFKSGAHTLVDVLLVLPGDITLRQANAVEDALRTAIVKEKKSVREVVVRFKPAAV